MKTPEEVNVLSAVFPLLKLLSVTVIGVIISHKKIQLVPRSTFKLLSKLVFALFLPCLIFTSLGPSISLQNLVLWWFIPVNIVISTAIGCFLGYLVALICRPPPEFFRFTIITTAFGNTGNIPLAVVSSICKRGDNPFGDSCYDSGLAYVSFSQWVCVILVYTLVYHMMEPPLEYYEVIEEEEAGGGGGAEIEEIREIQENEVVSVSNISTPLLFEAEWIVMQEKENEYLKTPFIAQLFNSMHSGLSQTSIPRLESIDESCPNPSSPRSLRCLAEPRVVRKMRIVAENTPVQHILQPPMIASFLAILIGVIPQLKGFVFGYDAPLDVFTDTLKMMAKAMVPAAMLILGGMLSEGPSESKLGMKTTIGIITARLIILPAIGIGVVSLADKWELLVAGDRLYRFVLLLQYTTPSAILLGAVASLRGYAIREASALLFWQHIFAVFSLSSYIILYFKMLPA